MVKGGWAASLSEAKEMPVDDIFKALAYEKFLGDYESAYLELNKDKP